MDPWGDLCRGGGLAIATACHWAAWFGPIMSAIWFALAFCLSVNAVWEIVRRHRHRRNGGVPPGMP